jgi:hypothetical protein
MPSGPTRHPRGIPSPGFIDGHVHLVGDGRSGSGCWLRLSGAHSLLARFMLRHVGLPSDALQRDFDTL